MDGEATYVDPWQEYKAISNKLKKRFLRKPNVAEASRQFLQLGRKLKDNECYNYAGLCSLAVARCEHSVGNVSGESSGLREAARHFCTAEKEKQALCFPGFEENLTNAIHCYSHAIRVHLEHSEAELASGLCMELGQALYDLGKPDEALEHFLCAVKLLKNCPLNHICALKWCISCYVDTGQHKPALELVQQLSELALNTCDQRPFGIYKALLSDCEILQILLLLRLNLLPAQMSESQIQLLASYAQPSGSIKELPGSYLDNEDLLLWLQSFAMAVQAQDRETADAILTQMWSSLQSVAQTLALSLVACCEELAPKPPPVEASSDQ